MRGIFPATVCNDRQSLPNNPTLVWNRTKVSFNLLVDPFGYLGAAPGDTYTVRASEMSFDVLEDTRTLGTRKELDFDALICGFM